MVENKILKHYRCPNCGRVTAAAGLIPACKCSGTSARKPMEEIKNVNKS